MCGDVAIADAKQQTVIRNSTVSEPAETVEGYYPETLSISAMITKDGQEIIFKYRAVQSWTYTVKYLLEGTKTPVPGSTVETGTTSDQNVMITFKTFEGYTLKSDPVQKVTQENQVVISTMYLRLQFIIYSTGMKDRMVNLDFAILIHSIQQQDSPLQQEDKKYQLMDLRWIQVLLEQ